MKKKEINDTLVEVPVDTTYTDSAGNYEFESLKAGDYAIYAEYEGESDTIAAFTEEFTVESDDPEDTITISELEMMPIFGVLSWIKPLDQDCPSAKISMFGGLRNERFAAATDTKLDTNDYKLNLEPYFLPDDNVGQIFIPDLAPGTYFTSLSVSCGSGSIRSFSLPLEITTAPVPGFPDADGNHFAYEVEDEGLISIVYIWHATDEASEKGSRMILITNKEFNAFLWVGKKQPVSAN